MAGTEVSETFDCSPAQFFDIIADVEKYPFFLDEVKDCKVVKTEGNRKLVEYSVSVVKSFKYRLWMIETKPTQLSWSFESGDLFSKSDGFWKLQEVGGKTKAIYSVDVKFKIFVPGPIAKALASVNLPNMMAAYKKRVKELYG